MVSANLPESQTATYSRILVDSITRLYLNGYMLKYK